MSELQDPGSEVAGQGKAATPSLIPASDAATRPKLETRGLDLYYGKFQALKGVSIRIKANAVTAMIGPSGCGKSTLLRVFNRMNDLIDGVRVKGDVLLDGEQVYGGRMSAADLRKRVGMVFQKPNPFPLSIFENVAYGPRIHDLARPEDLHAIVENAMRGTGLWDSLKDRLSDSALSLSPEQRQRLCISRSIAMSPEVILLDEPCSALDPIATAHIEELLLQLKEKYTIVIVTHNMQQAARISEETGFMLLGDLVEFGRTDDIFTNPKEKKTQDYVTGRFG